MADTAPGPVPSLIGAVLKDSYRIVRQIGSGGMGMVYEAEHTRLPRRFAVKVLRDSDRVDAESRERFRREAFTASAIGHRNIVEVLDFDTAPDGSMYMVMEYLEGEDLSERIRRRTTLAPAEAVAVARQVANALDVAHARGIVHRDLKPDNVFLCRQADGEEVAKILDFGICKVAAATSHLTHTTSFMGTPHCMAPEQARGESAKVDARTDVFALGVMVFEMLAGRPPFSGPTVDALLYQVVHEPVPSVRTLRPELPAAVDEVLARAMAKDREARFAGAGDFVRALAQALGMPAPPRAAVSEPPPPVVDAPPRTREPSREEIALAATAMAASTPSARSLAAESAGDAGSHPAAGGPATTLRVRRGRLVTVLVGGLLVGALAVALIVWGAGRRTDRSAARARDRVLAGRPTHVPSRTPQVEIRLDVTPATAEVRWDGRQVAGGVIRGPVDRRSHRLVVRAPGHEPVERSVVLDRTQTIVIVLAKQALTRPPPAKITTGRRNPPRPPRRPGEAGPTAPPIIVDPDGL